MTLSVTSDETSPVLIKNSKKPFWTRRRAVLAVVLVGLLIRLWTAWQLPQDFDEPVYLNAAYDYAKMIQAGDWNGIIDYPQVSEHPPLQRLVYGFVVLGLGHHAAWNTALLACRLVSVVFGSLGVWLMALVDPLAGLFWALQTLAVKYTSQVYLEALPILTALIALFAMRRSQRKLDGWFWLSAVALGLTAAGKYSYVPILFVILFVVIWEKRYRDFSLLPYLGVAALTFLVFDPHLWHQPIPRLIDSIMFHAQYSQSVHVQAVGYPWYQPFIWVARSNGFIWHPDVFFYLGIDGPIFLLALPGFWLEWKRNRYIPVWAALGMIFLLLWPTKWPQYTLVVLPAYCLAAASAGHWGYHYVREQDTYWEWFSNMFPRPSRRFLTWAGILMGGLILATMVARGVNLYNSIGWSSVTTVNAPLPSNLVYDLLPLPDGRMAVAMEGGLVFWKAAEKDDLQDKWLTYTPQNSSLPNAQVRCLALDPGGLLWVGTAGGLARLDGTTWQVYHAAEFGLQSEQVNAVKIGSHGQVWIGTSSGAAVYDGTDWKAYTPHNSGLWSETVFSLAVQPTPDGDRIWFGMLNAISSLDTKTQEWQTTLSSSGLIGQGGISDLFIDSKGRLWAATLGEGISIWDGQNWISLRTSNSHLPFNTVQEVEETEPGIFWIGTSNPAETGGVVARYDGSNWHVYRPILSGYEGGETLAIARDSTGRLWFGTRTKGIDLYKPRQ